MLASLSPLRFLSCMSVAAGLLVSACLKAETENERNLRSRLTRLVEAAQEKVQREEAGGTEHPAALSADANPHIAPRLDPGSGLHLVLKVEEGALPEGLTYSVSPAAGQSMVKTDKGGGLEPGLYELDVQLQGKPVYHQAFLALSGVLSTLELRYDGREFSLRQGLGLPQVKFVSNERRIAAFSMPVVDEISRLMKDHQAIQLIGLAVHTDSGGNESKNKALTEARALELKNALVKKGVRAERIQAVGYGSSRPLVANDSRENRVLNRRTEYLILENSPGQRLLGDR